MTEQQKLNRKIWSKTPQGIASFKKSSEKYRNSKKGKDHYKKHNIKYDEHYKRSYHLKLKFNMSLEDYTNMFDEQQGCCKICNRHQTEFKIALAVDHCHETGKIRGLLCRKCNLLIGFCNDSIEQLNNAIKYLNN